jgi:hypothetical protein
MSETTADLWSQLEHLRWEAIAGHVFGWNEDGRVDYGTYYSDREDEELRTGKEAPNPKGDRIREIAGYDWAVWKRGEDVPSRPSSPTVEVTMLQPVYGARDLLTGRTIIRAAVRWSDSERRGWLAWALVPFGDPFADIHEEE